MLYVLSYLELVSIKLFLDFDFVDSPVRWLVAGVVHFPQHRNMLLATADSSSLVAGLQDRRALLSSKGARPTLQCIPPRSLLLL